MTSHKFSVGIMGEFMRGKSTVINALIGWKIMPADILPCLATMNRVTYDLQFHAQVIKNDGSVIEVSVDEIADESVQQTVCLGCGSCPVRQIRL